jgi:hypothetical protein
MALSGCGDICVARVEVEGNATFEPAPRTNATT